MNSIKAKKSFKKAWKIFGNVKHSSYLYYINKKKDMIALSVQDAADGKGKVAELRSAIGQSFGFYKSSTGRSKLISVSEDGNTCVVQDTESDYRKPSAIMIRTAPSWLIWNAIFY